MVKKFRNYELNGETVYVEEVSKLKLVWYKVVDKIEPWFNIIKLIVLWFNDRPDICMSFGMLGLLITAVTYEYDLHIVNFISSVVTSALFTIALVNGILKIRKAYDAKD